MNKPTRTAAWQPIDEMTVAHLIHNVGAAPCFKVSAPARRFDGYSYCELPVGTIRQHIDPADGFTTYAFRHTH